VSAHWGRSALVVLGLLASGTSSGLAAPGGAPPIPVPSAGNITVARVAVAYTGRSLGAGAPQPRLASSGALPAGAFAVATVGKGARPSQFVVTIAIIRPSDKLQAGPAKGGLSLRLPRGFSFVGAAQVAKNVLYENPSPSFGMSNASTETVLAGKAPTKFPIERVVRDAQLLAFDRSIPLVDAGLLGLPYVSADFTKAGTTVRVTIGVSNLNQVNAVELAFATGVKVTRAAGVQGTDGILVEGKVQLISSRGFFQEGVPYAFTLQLSRAPKTGDSVVVRASTHYFESALPFRERFVLS
jgi:hypothetical protein